MQSQFRLLLHDREATRHFGQALAQSIDDGAVIALIGPMGAGKTTLVKSVASELGITEVVSSPTFTMLNEYHSGRLPLYHMDLYRLSEEKVPAPLDLLIAEIEEFIGLPMVAMVEWAELFPSTFISDAPDSKVSSPNSSASYLSQLDHIVIKLMNYRAADGATLKSPVGEPLQVDGGGETENDPANRINKDEEVRIADLSAHGDQSSQVLTRLVGKVAAMLIYS